MCRGGERNKWSQSGWPKLMSHSQAGRQVCKERLIFCVLKEPHLTSPHRRSWSKQDAYTPHTPHTPHTLHTHAASGSNKHIHLNIVFETPPHGRQGYIYRLTLLFREHISTQVSTKGMHIKFKLKGQFTPKKKKRKFSQLCYVLLPDWTFGPTQKYTKCILKYNI